MTGKAFLPNSITCVLFTTALVFYFLLTGMKYINTL